MRCGDEVILALLLRVASGVAARNVVRLVTIELAGHSEPARLIVPAVVSVPQSLWFLVRSRTALHLEVIALDTSWPWGIVPAVHALVFTAIDHVMVQNERSLHRHWSAASPIITSGGHTFRSTRMLPFRAPPNRRP
jgi:hypothetical protein